MTSHPKAQNALLQRQISVTISTCSLQTPTSPAAQSARSFGTANSSSATLHLLPSVVSLSLKNLIRAWIQSCFNGQFSSGVLWWQGTSWSSTPPKLPTLSPACKALLFDPPKPSVFEIQLSHYFGSPPAQFSDSGSSWLRRPTSPSRGTSTFQAILYYGMNTRLLICLQLTNRCYLNQCCVWQLRKLNVFALKRERTHGTVSGSAISRSLILNLKEKE